MYYPVKPLIEIKQRAEATMDWNFTHGWPTPRFGIREGGLVEVRVAGQAGFTEVAVRAETDDDAEDLSLATSSQPTSTGTQAYVSSGLLGDAPWSPIVVPCRLFWQLGRCLVL